MLFTLPAFSGMILYLLRCQGFGVAYYSLTPWTPWIYSALGFCNVGNTGKTSEPVREDE